MLHNLGLLLLRIGIGTAFLVHGFPKLIGGFAVWSSLGANMEYIGITFAPIAWGFLAACVEFFGAIALILGLYTRIAAFFMASVMLIATIMLIKKGSDFITISHPFELFIVFTSIIVMGGGKWSLKGE